MQSFSFTWLKRAFKNFLVTPLKSNETFDFRGENVIFAAKMTTIGNFSVGRVASVVFRPFWAKMINLEV